MTNDFYIGAAASDDNTHLYRVLSSTSWYVVSTPQPAFSVDEYKPHGYILSRCLCVMQIYLPSGLSSNIDKC